MKLSGDGAVIAASATMVFLTFSFPGLCENVLSAAGQLHTVRNLPVLGCTYIGNHTFASVRGPEQYDFLKACFEPVWKELQDLIADPHLVICGKEVHLDIVFGSDYKVGFLSTVLV
jgi:hypothetical protein